MARWANPGPCGGCGAWPTCTDSWVSNHVFAKTLASPADRALGEDESARSVRTNLAPTRPCVVDPGENTMPIVIRPYRSSSTCDGVR
jgi:hypothetical protein